MGKIAVDNSEANKALDETGSSAEKAQGRLSGAFSKVSGAGATLAKGVGVAAAGVAGVVGSMIGLSTSTEDYAVQQGKLTTAFETTGKTADQANATYSELNAVLGDSDTAVEAAGNIAQLAKSQSDLDKWTTIATGAYATFGDGLPIEGLAEAANETAKCGTVTGSMADALNWTSASMDTWNTALSGNKAAQEAFNAAIENGATKEDAFNEALAACNTEGERAQLVTDTLNGLYAEAGEKYRENNAALLESRKAQDAWNSAIGQAGEAVRPFVTALLEVGTSIVNAVMPYLQQFSDWASQVLPVVTDAFGQFAGFLGETLGGAISAISPVLQGLAGTFQQLWDGFTNGIGIIQSFTEPWQTLEDGMWRNATAGEGLANNLTLVADKMGILTPWMEQLFTAIGNLVDNGIARFQGILGAIQPYIDPFLQSIQNLASAFLDNLGPAISSAIGFMQRMNEFWAGVMQPVIETIAPIIIQLATTIMNKAAEIVNTVLPAAQRIFDKLTEVMDAIQPLVEGAMSFIMGIVQDVWPRIQSTIENVMDRIHTVIDSVMGIIEGIIDTVMGVISGDWDRAWNGISQIVDSVMNGLGAIVQGALDIVSGIIDSVLGAIGSAWESAWSGLSGFVSDAWENIKSGVSDGINGVLDFVSGLPGKIVNALGDLGGTLLQAGKDLINGFAKGIRDAAGSAIEGAKNMAGKVVGGVTSFLGIKSPSRVFAQIGRYSIQGLDVGFEDETDNAVRSVEGSVRGIVDAANKTVAKHPIDSMTVTQTATQATLDGLARSIDDLYGLVANYMPQLLAASDKQIVLNTGALVGATAGAYDTELGNISRRRARGQ